MGKTMQVRRTKRRFLLAEFRDANGEECSLQQSSAIGDYPDAAGRPGTSFVWLGRDADRMHLSREQVRELVCRLGRWLEAGDFGDDGGRQPTP
jgi:hypothetical protein